MIVIQKQQLNCRDVQRTKMMNFILITIFFRLLYFSEFKNLSVDKTMRSLCEVSGDWCRLLNFVGFIYKKRTMVDTMDQLAVYF